MARVHSYNGTNINFLRLSIQNRAKEQIGDAGRVFWRSRRGLLELDLYLVPFATKMYFSLEPSLQVLYKDILEYDDVQLLDWLQEREDPPKAYRELVAMIRDQTKSDPRNKPVN